MMPKKIRHRSLLITVGGVLLAGTIAFADGTRFSDFTPLASSAGPTADESAPITFGNPRLSSGPSRSAMPSSLPASPTPAVGT